MSRPQKCRHICSKPNCGIFEPSLKLSDEIITLGFDEYETVRLIDYENYSQTQCAEKMQVARTTVTRMYNNARKKIAEALVCSKSLKIDGGDVIVCSCMKPECRNVKHCCHRNNGGIKND